jgi:ABC-2 type transport system permease protein
VSFVGAAVAEGIGALLVRAPVLFVVAGAVTFVLTRQLPPLTVIAAIVPLGLLASAWITTMHVGLGMLAFWLGDASPLWWVTQKALFVLGGMMMPLSLYPLAIQRVAAFTPFPTVLSGPATLVLHGSLDGAGALAVALVGWSLALGVALQLLFWRATHALTVNGG